jgi:hypothetical protein
MKESASRPEQRRRRSRRRRIQWRGYGGPTFTIARADGLDQAAQAGEVVMLGIWPQSAWRISRSLCNRYKGSDVATRSGRAVRLFHPRRDTWTEHFDLFDNGEIRHKTAIGEASTRIQPPNQSERVLSEGHSAAWAGSNGLNA